MGFSTSAATAVMLIGFLVAASVFFPAVFTASSDTGDAFAAQADQTRDRLNTALDVTTAEQETTTDDEGNDEMSDVTVTVENVGTTSLDVSKTDVLLDGVYIDPDDTTRTVIDDGDRIADTDVWYPGSALEIVVPIETIEESFEDGYEVDRAKVTTETGISVSATIETEGG